MSNYNQASIEGRKLIIKFFAERMVNLNISKYRLAKLTEISEPTIGRYFSLEIDMPLTNYLKICGALDLRPYLIPADEDTNEFQFIHFN